MSENQKQSAQDSNPTRTRERGKRKRIPQDLPGAVVQKYTQFHRVTVRQAGGEAAYVRTNNSATFDTRTDAKGVALSFLRWLRDTGKPERFALSIEPCPNPQGGNNLYMIWARTAGEARTKAKANPTAA